MEIDWTHILLAVIAGFPATVTAFGAILMSLRNGRKADNISDKIDDNTAVTKSSAKDATTNARVAATAASSADDKLSDLLNGGLDKLIRGIVREHTEPLARSFKDHDNLDRRNMDEIRQSLIALGAQRDPPLPPPTPWNHT